jgi:6-phospho-beta-glucosidase
VKLAVIGGGGVRTPLLMGALARRAGRLGLKEVQLMDLDERKLSVIAPLCALRAEQAGGTFRLTWTTDRDDALTGADAVITTIRVGGERARAIDERIALGQGVLGQETTGAGGFAMALRSIPAIAECAERMRVLCPDAWLLNFTNPAGLVVQALTTKYPDLKVAGICDTPSSLRRDVAWAFGFEAAEVDVRVYGLNHLSWMPEANAGGEDLVPLLLADNDRLRAIPELALFDPPLLRLLGMLPNEYLYYYYYRDRALANLRAAGETRGEQVLRLSAGLIDELESARPAERPRAALQMYRRYLARRHGSYMAIETGHGSVDLESGGAEPVVDADDEGEGYAGVALDILEGARRPGATIVANVPNSGAISGMQGDDVLEISCRCDASGLHPMPQENVDDDALLLMREVKRYERLTVEAIAAHSRGVAVEALLAHPLIGSYPTACSLVDAYLTQHREWVGEWT